MAVLTRWSLTCCAFAVVLLSIPCNGFQDCSEKSIAYPDKSEEWRNADSVYDFAAIDENGQLMPLCLYKGYVLIILNIASDTRFTKEFLEEFNDTYRVFKNFGLRILGFLSESPFNRDIGNDTTIIKHYRNNYNVKFDLFQKVATHGLYAHPLFKYLEKEEHGFYSPEITLSFTSIIINKHGKPVDHVLRFTPQEELKIRLLKYVNEP